MHRLSSLIMLFLALFVSSFSSHAEYKVSLTPEEQAWLDAHPDIKFTGDPNWLPGEAFQKDGKYVGIVSEYLSWIEFALSIEIERIPTKTWSESMELALSRKVDILSAGSTAERKKHFSFSEPIFESPIIFTSLDSSKPKFVDDSMAGVKIAVPRGYYFVPAIKKDYPSAVFVEVTTVRDALQLLLKGEVSGVVASAMSILYERKLLQAQQIRVDFNTPHKLSLGLGIRKDWPELVPIVNKAIAQMPQDLKLQIQQDWLGTAGIEGGHLLSGGNGIYLVYWLPAFFVLLLLFAGRLFLKRTVQAHQVSHKKLTQFSWGLVAVMLIVVTLVALNILKQKEIESKKQTGESLQALLETTTEALNMWVASQEVFIDSLAKDRVMIEAAQDLTTYGYLPAELEKAPERNVVDLFLSRATGIDQKQTFMVLDNQGYVVYHNESVSLGKQHPSLSQHTEFLKVLDGETGFVAPVRGLTRDYRLYFMAPLNDIMGLPFGALVIGLDPKEDFSRILQLGRVGETGETYAFDREGVMLSESLFSEELLQKGLIGSDSSKLSFRLFRPGTQELTPMVASAVLGHSGVDVTGWQDYRGAPVFSAWKWDDDLGMGLTSEIDQVEAMKTHNLITNTVYTILGVTFLLSIILTLFNGVLSRRVTETLQKAKQELEQKVYERTLELKASSDELEAREERLYLALRGGNLGFWDTDLKSGETVVNPRYAEIYGYPASPLTINREDWLNTIYEEDKERVLQTGSNYRHGQLAEYEVEHRIVTLQGDVRWVVTKGSAVKTNDQSQVKRMVGTVQDITEKKHQEQQIKNLLESVGSGVVGADLDGRITFANSLALKILGYKLDEMLGQELHELVHHSHEDGSKYHKLTCPMYQAQKIGKSFHIDNEVLWRKNGSFFYVEYHATPLKYNHKAEGVVVSFNDISKKVLAEKAAEENQQRFEMIFETISTPLLIIEKGQIIDCNQATVDLLGFESKKAVMAQTPATLSPEHQPDGQLSEAKAAAEIQKAIDLGRYKFEWVHSKKNGDTVPIEVHLSVFKLLGDNVLLAAWFDLTERKAAEKTIKESEQRTRAIIDSAADGIIVIDQSGTVQTFSPAAESMFGYGRADIIGQNIKMLMPESVSQHHDQYLHDYSETGEKHIIDKPREVKALRSDGTEFDVELKVSQVELGQQKVFVGLIRDITEQKAAQELIRKSEQRFKISTESAGIATWEWYIKEDKTVASPLYEKLFGFDPEQEKVSEVWASRLHPEDMERTFTALTDHLAGKTDSYYAEFRYRHPSNDEYVWLSGAGKVVEYDEEGEPAVVMGINEDITERKEAEAQVQQINETLTEKLGVLERFQNITIDRELKMIDLKKEVNELLVSNSQSEKYKIVSLDDKDTENKSIQ